MGMTATGFYDAEKQKPIAMPKSMQFWYTYLQLTWFCGLDLMFSETNKPYMFGINPQKTIKNRITVQKNLYGNQGVAQLG